MKTKFTILTLIMLFVTSINFAQTSFNNADIAVQGIARDDNNTALAGKSVNFTFTIYYDTLDPKNIFTQAITLQTDAFGVFSHTLNVGTDKIALIANQQAFLRIEAEGNIISNEALKHVPYAISANNGVPTGSIMPFIGTTAPPGWVLCNGGAIPDSGAGGAGYALSQLLSSTNAPDLGGMFLRGVGTNDYTTQNTLLMKEQDDATVRHTHGVSGNTNSDGVHTHKASFGYRNVDNGTGSFAYANDAHAVSSHGRGGHSIASTDSEHSHAFSTNTDTGAGLSAETRPVNYGVNYIIKL